MMQARRKQSGLSMVELLVGTTVGLFVTAGSALLVSGQLTDNRRLLLETQLQQDLRAAADIVTRDLRRAGFTSNASQNFVAFNAPGAAFVSNGFTGITTTTGMFARVDYSYQRNAFETLFGFSRNPSTTSLRTKLAGGVVQDLTDPKTMNITSFDISPLPVTASPAPLACPKECPGGGTACWPTLGVRGYKVSITGQSYADPKVVRTLVTEVRIRNDVLNLDPSLTTKVCPQ